MLRNKTNCPHFKGAQDRIWVFPPLGSSSQKNISTSVICIILDTSTSSNSHNTELAGTHVSKNAFCWGHHTPKYQDVQMSTVECLIFWVTEWLFQNITTTTHSRQVHTDWLWSTILTVAVMESLKLVQRKTVSTSTQNFKLLLILQNITLPKELYSRKSIFFF